MSVIDFLRFRFLSEKDSMLNDVFVVNFELAQKFLDRYEHLSLNKAIATSEFRAISVVSRVIVTINCFINDLTKHCSEKNPVITQPLVWECADIRVLIEPALANGEDASYFVTSQNFGSWSGLMVNGRARALTPPCRSIRNLFLDSLNFPDPTQMSEQINTEGVTLVDEAHYVSQQRPV